MFGSSDIRADLVAIESILDKIDMSTPASVLIIEDEDILADNLKTFFCRRTADVRIATDGESAMEMVKSFTPDLVVFDYALPGIDGLSAYGNIVRSSSRQPSCVMITGFLTDLMAETASRQGISQLLCKPFSFAELQHAVDLSAGETPGVSCDANRRVKERRTQQIHWAHTNRRCQLRRR